MLRFCEGVGNGVPDSMSWAKPRIALSGVRSSWLMLERKSDFARLAFSATAIALFRSSSTCLRTELSVPISRYPMMSPYSSRSAVIDTMAGKRPPFLQM